MSEFIDLTGQRFGRLTVVELTENSSRGEKRWKCQCDCGRYNIVSTHDLQRRSSLSCGKCNTYYEHLDGYMTCRVRDGHEFIIDKTDYKKVVKYTWHITPRGYVVAMIDNKLYKLHRFILNIFDKTITVDHINHNGCDNRKCNLRFCTQQQNNWNAQKHKEASSKYKGVSWHMSVHKWQAYINYNHKRICLGCFDSEEEAALEYNKKAKELFGEFAYINQIKENNK